MGGAFRTVDGPGEAAFEVRGSTFRGRVARVESVDAAEAVVAGEREANADASHVVACYRVRQGDSETGVLLREWQTDDGEPTGSAGKPALNVLVQREVENVVATVVRHFGGTELGVGGLARAYGRAVADAVDDAGVVDAVPHETLRFEADYDDSGAVRTVLERAGVEYDAAYEERVTFEARVPSGEAAELRDAVRSATSGRVG